MTNTTTTTVNINNIESVKGFVKAANKLSCDVTVYSGEYAVDGKSIMGVFSLNLSKNLLVEFSEKLTQEEFEPFSQWEVSA